MTEIKPTVSEGTEKAFELIDPKNGEVLAVYKNKTARPAAIKAAGEGLAKIILRERGAQEGHDFAARLHVFDGKKTQMAWPLPYPDWLKKSVEKKAGKTMPADLNAKGKDGELVKAGFKPYMYNKGSVKKVGVVKVPKLEGKSPKESMVAYLKENGNAK